MRTSWSTTIAVIGDRVILHSGAVIGADGFGLAWEGGRWNKIPQIGRVVIGNDVEVGANTTIDRGALDDTVIEEGVKLDNQIQIGHNCRIGAHTAIAGCVGIAGSTRIGRYCRIGGSAMIGGHLDIADNVEISGATAVPKSILKPGTYTSLFPISPHRDWLKNASYIRHLDALAGRRARIWSAPGRTARKQAMNKMEIREILDYLPHRFPFLLIDRVLSCEPGKSIVAIKNVAINEPFFQGHFPGNPVMPGVMILEALAQAAAILSFKTLNHQSTAEPAVLLRRHRRRALQEAGDSRRPAGAQRQSAAASARHRQVRRARDGRRSAGDRGRAVVHAQGGMIHPTAIVHPGARLAPDVEVGPYTIIGEHVEIGAGTPRRAARRHHRAYPHRQRQSHLPVRLARRSSAGQEVRRRADAPGDRRPQRHSRVLHVQYRHRAGRRRHARGRRQLDHGVRASGARLRGRQPYRARQQRDAWPATLPSAITRYWAARPWCISSAASARTRSPPADRSCCATCRRT